MSLCDHWNEDYQAELSCGTVYYAVQGGSNFWVCGWNPMVLPYKWKLLSRTFLWYCLFCCTKWFLFLIVNEIPCADQSNESYWSRPFFLFRLFVCLFVCLFLGGGRWMLFVTKRFLKRPIQWFIYAVCKFFIIFGKIIT